MTIANVNIRQVLLKRGTTVRSEAYVGPLGELTLDTDLDTVRVHDGVTPGGITTLATQAQINAITSGTATFGNIIPSANVTYSLGNEQYQWRDLWVSNNTIYIGNTPITVSGNSLLVNGATVSGGSADRLVNGDNSAILNSDGSLTFPNNLNITQDGGTSIIGKSGVGTLTQEGPGGTISETTTTGSQVEIEPYTVVIGSKQTVVSDDGIVTATDIAGSKLEIGLSTMKMESYAEPEGPNNTAYSRVYTEGTTAGLKAAVQDVYGTIYSSVEVEGGTAVIRTTDGALERQWTFGATGDLTLPAGGDILDSNGDSVLGVAGLYGNTDYTPEVEGDVFYQLDIDENIVLNVYLRSGQESDGGPGILLGSGDSSKHRSGVIAIGNGDVGSNSKRGGVYIGAEAGFNNDKSPQGEYAIAIGAKAAREFAPDNSIALNATGIELNPTGAGLFVAPITEDVSNTTKSLYYNTATKEITYAAAATGSGSATNIWVETFVSDRTGGDVTDVVQAATSVEYDTDGNVIALFSHAVEAGGSIRYNSVAKFDSAGTRLWSVRFGNAQFTDGWGLAVDNARSLIYVAGGLSGTGHDKTTLTQINSVNGELVWAATYDFGDNSFSPVVDVDSNGDPIMVGYASGGGDNYVSTVKVSRVDGAVIWAQALNGQNSDEAYGMAVGPDGEIITVGYVAQQGTVGFITALKTTPTSNANWTTGTAFSQGGFSFTVNFTAGVPTFTDIVDIDGNHNPDDQVAFILGSALGGVDSIDDMTVQVDTVNSTDEADRMLIVKYGNDGTLAWQKSVQFDAGFDCSGADADVDSAGNIYVCGQYTKSNGNNGTTSAMNIVKFDSSGVKQWSRRVVGNCVDFATSIVVGPDDYLYLSALTGNNNTNDFSLVIAKYYEDGRVAWQRLLDNVNAWTTNTSFGFGNPVGGGSNLAVRDGYVAIAGAFGGPNSTASEFMAVVAQVSTDGTEFAVGDWDFKGASFSGVLNGTASDITVANAGKTASDIASAIATWPDSSPGYEVGSFLIGTVYRQGQSNTGDITFSGIKIQGNGNTNTVGSIELVPNPTLYSAGQYVKIYPTNQFDYPHVHIAAGTGGELYIGNDTQYVKTAYDGSIGVQSYNSGTSTAYSWTFDADGVLDIPNQATGDRGTIFNSNGGVELYSNATNGIIQLRAKGLGGDNTWRFENDGAITFPSQASNNRTGTGENLKFVKSNSQKIISTGNGTVDQNTVERLVIAGGDSYNDDIGAYSGEGGDIYLWAGFGSDGGDIKVDAGDAFGTYGGTVKVRAGSSYAENGEGGFLELRAGNGNNLGGVGGDITIKPGHGAGQDGVVRIKTGDNTKSWTFGAAGALTFPDATVQSTAWNPDTIDWAAIIGPSIQTNGLPVGTRFTQPVPLSSLGQTGDTAGTVAFNGSYIYYCIQNFGGPAPVAIAVLAASGTGVWVNSSQYTGDLVADFTANSTGWTYNNVAITSIEVDNQFGAGYLLYAATDWSVFNGFNYNLQAPGVTDIWRRVALNGGAW